MNVSLSPNWSVELMLLKLSSFKWNLAKWMKNLHESTKFPNHQDTLEEQVGYTGPTGHENLKISID